MKDLTEGKLTETLEYAKSIKDESLQKCIESLERVDKNIGTETRISVDYAPKSFYFVRMREEQFVSNGGIIFHGSKETGHMKNDAVQMEHTLGWSIHT